MSRLERENSSANTLVAILGVALAALWVGLVFIYRQPGKKDAVTPGFDVKAVQEPPPETAAAPPPREEEPSGLSLVTNTAPSADALKTAPASAPPPAPPAASHAPAEPAGDPASRLREDFRKQFTQLRDLSYAYKKKYPSVASWAKDWHDNPELHKLNEQYLRDQDAVAYLKGLARSDSFPGMVRKYAGDPGIMAYLGGVVGQLPQLVGTGMSYAMNDALLKPFAEKAMSDAALPPALAAAASASGALAAAPAASR